ncbi:hypothetical protein BC829DRAFT_26108 [Chytridium lagenaria]|nr:hypothetical protein BC829DRAFT_26108 [Chytridium lagenaria]
MTMVSLKSTKSIPMNRPYTRPVYDAPAVNYAYGHNRNAAATPRVNAIATPVQRNVATPVHKNIATPVHKNAVPTPPINYAYGHYRDAIPTPSNNNINYAHKKNIAKTHSNTSLKPSTPSNLSRPTTSITITEPRKERRRPYFRWSRRCIGGRCTCRWTRSP